MSIRAFEQFTDQSHTTPHGTIKSKRPAAWQCFKGGHVLRVDRDENGDVVVNPADPAREYFAVPGF